MAMDRSRATRLLWQSSKRLIDLRSSPKFDSSVHRSIFAGSTHYSSGTSKLFRPYSELNSRSLHTCLYPLKHHGENSRASVEKGLGNTLRIQDRYFGSVAVTKNPAFSALNFDDISYFKGLLGEKNVIQDEDRLQDANTDWMRKFKGSSKLLLQPTSTEEVIINIGSMNKIISFDEDGKYQEALGKWEAALSLMPESAVVHEQKAQVLLEIGNAWEALKAAARATELEPTWAEAWITLGRAQLNFGEPDSAIESFDKALAIKPDSEEAQDDKQTALRLVKRREQLHSSGLSNAKNRYAVGDESKS